MQTQGPLSAEIVDKLGVISFIMMTTLIMVCILIGFYAVIDSYSTPQPNWQAACIEAGGVPVQLGSDQFDCKVLEKT